MAISDKETALRLIEQLPDDASLDDIAVAIDRHSNAVHEGTYVGAYAESDDQDNSRPVKRRPVKNGYLTVLEPTRPVPAVSAELVTYIVEQMQRQREERFMGLTEDDG
jgi:hypothetical protein